MRYTVALLALGAGLAGGACAPGVPAPGPVTPAELVALEAQRTRQADDPDALTRIGIRFYQAREYARARDVLAAVLVLRGGTGGQGSAFNAAVHLGLAEEALGDYDAALVAYRRAQTMRVSGRSRTELEQRLVALTRVRLAAEARQAIAAEATLSAARPEPNTVAVLPWTYLGAEESLRPLEVGLAHLVVTDLAKVTRLRLVERERVQALVTEFRLDQAGRADPGTAARSGRLLRAGRVVQGAIREGGDSGTIRLDANVVSTGDTGVEASGTASDRLQRLFDLEKAVVFQLLDRMGITLTPAERRAIGERPTADLQAFLAFSRGLGAEDRGDLAAARQFFDQAAARDPGFSQARQRAMQATRLSLASRVTQDRLSAAAGAGAAAGGAAGAGPGGGLGGAGIRADANLTSQAQLRAALQTVAPSAASRLLRQTLLPHSPLKSRLAEALHQDDASRLALLGTIVVVIPRP